MHFLVPALLILASAPSDTTIVPLPEVVVTGVRTPEPAQRVPAAISVVDRSRFEFSRALSLKDALEFVPGVFVQSRAGAQDVRITIRGFGARGNGERSNTGVLRGIRVLTDGIPVTEPDGRTAFDLVDLSAVDRVEISRSNASATYGNAAGGVINLRTNLDFGSPFVEVRERAGSFGFHREQGVVGFVVGQGRGVFTLGNTSFDGWRPHSQSTAAQASARFSTPLDPDTRLGILIDAVSDLNRFPGPLTQAELDSLPRQASAPFVTRDDRRRNRVGRLAVTLDRHIEASQDLWVSLFVEPKVLQRSERNRFRDFNRYHVGGSAVYDLRTHPSPSIESRTSFGADDAFQDGTIQFHDLAPGGGRGTDLVANKREGANSAGGFVQEELVWNKRWSARGALRYDNLWYIAQDYVDPVFDATRHFTRVTPKGSISYLADAHTFYASLGGGVEAPAFNEIDPPAPFDTLTSFNPFLEPMRSSSWELGAKGRAQMPAGWGGLRYDVALYWIDVANDIVPFDGGAYFFTAGKSRRQGMELGLGWSPTRRITLTGAATLSKNEYREYANELGNFAGRKIAGLPQAVVNAAVRCMPVDGLSAEVGVSSVGSYYADDANTAKAPGYALLNGSLGYVRTVGAGTFKAFIAGENLTDRDHVASVFINGASGRYFEPGLPRNWSAGLSLRWK